MQRGPQVCQRPAFGTIWPQQTSHKMPRKLCASAAEQRHDVLSGWADLEPLSLLPDREAAQHLNVVPHAKTGHMVTPSGRVVPLRILAAASHRRYERESHAHRPRIRSKPAPLLLRN
jgi:hypothetical protein